MRDTAFADSVVNTPVIGSTRAFETIVYGDLVVGVLDYFDATIFSWLRGGSPIRAFQFVASGVIGRDAAYNGGIKTYLLGVLFHFMIATGVATVFYFAGSFLPILIRYAVVCGMVYGIGVHFFMSKVVIPLSATPKPLTPPPFSLASFLNSIIGHALLVGLPVALIARWSAKRNH